MRLKANLMDAVQLRRAVIRIAHEIVEDNRGADRLVMVGIGKRGIPLAENIAAVVQTLENTRVPVGRLDVGKMNGCDDKLAVAESLGVSVEGAVAVLVNDVLSSGRTVSAAVDILMRVGTPAKIRLAVIADKGVRELPVSADYTGVKLSTIGNDIVSVSVAEIDGISRVDLYGTDE